MTQSCLLFIVKLWIHHVSVVYMQQVWKVQKPVDGDEIHKLSQQKGF